MHNSKSYSLIKLLLPLLHALLTNIQTTETLGIQRHKTPDNPQDAFQGTVQISALYDYKAGSIYYRDESSQICYTEKLLQLNQHTQFIILQPTGSLSVHSPRRHVHSAVPISPLAQQFCANFSIIDAPILRPTANDNNDDQEGPQVHPESVRRNKRSSGGQYWAPQQSGGSQSQIQGQVSGQGFFSGQAQSQFGGASQSQVQLSGTGILGSVSSSAGNAQAQIALAQRTGSGQASSSGSGPANSQVQVNLGEDGRGSLASASVLAGQGGGSQYGGGPSGRVGWIPGQGTYGQNGHRAGFVRQGSPQELVKPLASTHQGVNGFLSQNGEYQGSNTNDESMVHGSGGAGRSIGGTGTFGSGGMGQNGQLAGQGGLVGSHEGSGVQGGGYRGQEGTPGQQLGQVGQGGGYSRGQVGSSGQYVGQGGGYRGQEGTPGQQLGQVGQGGSSGQSVGQGGIPGGLGPGNGPINGPIGGGGVQLGSPSLGHPGQEIGHVDSTQLGGPGQPGGSGVDSPLTYPPSNGYQQTYSGRPSGQQPQFYSGQARTNYNGNGGSGGGYREQNPSNAAFGNGFSGLPQAFASSIGGGQAQAQTVYLGRGTTQFYSPTYGGSSYPGGSDTNGRSQTQYVAFGGPGGRQSGHQSPRVSTSGYRPNGLPPSDGYRQTTYSNGNGYRHSSTNDQYGSSSNIGSHGLGHRVPSTSSAGLSGLPGSYVQPQLTTNEQRLVEPGQGVAYGGSPGSYTSQQTPSNGGTNLVGGYTERGQQGHQLQPEETGGGPYTSLDSSHIPQSTGQSFGGGGSPPVYQPSYGQRRRTNEGRHSAGIPATNFVQTPGDQNGYAPSYGVSQVSPEDPSGSRCTIITFSCTIMIESNGRAKICRPNVSSMGAKETTGSSPGIKTGQNAQQICCC